MGNQRRPEVVGAELGRIPFRLRIGVTGHRDTPDDAAIRAGVDEAIERIRRAAPSSDVTPLLFEVVSPLGEGADRVVAERVLAVAGATLEAPLPLATGEYLKDFRSEDAKQAFRSLLARSDASPVMPWAPGRPGAYSEVGEYVVDTSDVLIAVWNGRPAQGPGGTGDVIARAISEGMPRIVISPREPFAVADHGLDHEWLIFRGLERFNRPAVPRAPGARAPAGVPFSDRTIAAASPAVHAAAKEVERWVRPSFERADRLAVRAQRRFVVVGRCLSLFAAAAVATVATQSIFFAEQVRAAWVEVGLMLAVLGMWLWARERVHESWISFRFLAERLRASAYLALLDMEGFPGDTPTGEHRGNARQEWLTRAFREVWRRRPTFRPDPSQTRELVSLIRSEWIDGQIAYYRSRGAYHRRAHRIQLWTTGILFAATAAAATLHALGVGEGSAGARWVILASIVLPVLGGAASWVGALEEHHRLGERFASMSRRLFALGERLERVGDLPSLRELAGLVDAELRTETGQWIDVMRYHDIDLPS